MKRSPAKLLCAFFPLVSGLTASSIILIGTRIFVHHATVAQALTYILSNQFSKGVNYFLLAFINLLPFVVLSFVLFFYVKKHSLRQSWGFSISGKLGILAFMAPAHIITWTGSSSISPITLVFIPVFSTGTLFIGLFFGRLVTRLPWFQQKGARK